MTQDPGRVKAKPGSGLQGDRIYARSNKHRWARSITGASHKAYPNKWFIQEIGQKIKSPEKHSHWFTCHQWIKLT